MVARERPFTSHEWKLFISWLNYLEKGLVVAHELHQKGDKSPGSFEVSEAVTAVRWYATDLALLLTLVYRAAGRRQDERACYDQELSDLYEELNASYPKLRDLRNALFAHPPFVDRVVSSDEVLFFTDVGVHVAPVAGGYAESIVDVFLAHHHLTEAVVRIRDVFRRRAASTE